MVYGHHRLEDFKQQKVETLPASKAQLEVEQEREKKNGTTAPTADRSQKDNDILPSLTIEDKVEPTYSSSEELKENGNRILLFRSNTGVTSEIEFNTANQPVRYRDMEGEEFVSSDPGNEQGTWKSTSNRIQQVGIRLKFDSTDNSVQMTDLDTKNVVTVTAGGVETTVYAPSNGKTIRKVAGKEEWITTQDATGSVRDLYVVDNKLQRYTDDQNVTYTLSNQSITQSSKKDDTDASSSVTVVPLYRAVGPTGEEIPGRFTISANRTGNVMVRNEDSLAEPDSCRRVRVDGAVVTSNGDGSVRTFRTSSGIEIQSKLMWQIADTKYIEKTILYPDGTRIDAQMADGVPSHFLKKTDSDGQVHEYHQKLGRDEVLYWMDRDGNNIGDVSSLTDTRELEDAPRAIQKTPANLNMKAMLDECEAKQVYSLDTIGSWRDNGKLFYQKVNYGGVWDVKSPATRTINEENQEVIIKDQMGRPEYEDYGNWLFGVMGHKVGFPSYILQQEAGAAQIRQGTSRQEWGAPGLGLRGARIPWTGAGTYGDDPRDNQLIQQGYSDAEQVEQEVRNAA